MRHRLLDDAPPDTHAAHQAPIAVDFPVLLANRVAQVHAPSEPPPQQKKIPKVVTTRSNHPRASSNPLIRLAPPRAKSQKIPPNCASWVSRRSTAACVSSNPRRPPAERGQPGVTPPVIVPQSIVITHLSGQMLGLFQFHILATFACSLEGLNMDTEYNYASAIVPVRELLAEADRGLGEKSRHLNSAAAFLRSGGDAVWSADSYCLKAVPAAGACCRIRNVGNVVITGNSSSLNCAQWFA